MTNKIAREGNEGVMYVPDVGAAYFSMGKVTSENYSNISSPGGSQSSWEADAENVLGKMIVPYGVNNSLPTEIRDIFDVNNLAPGIIEREIGLLWGQGPYLYKEDIVDNEIVRLWVKDKEVQQWLDSWQYKNYLDRVVTEFKHLKGHFTKYKMNRGARIGRESKIASLECVPGTDARLEWVESRRLEDVKHIFTGDFENNCNTGIRTFKRFRFNDPFRYPTGIDYHCSSSFARNFYAVPGFYGGLNWIKRSSDIPEILKFLTDNSIALAYHFESPQAYWDAKEEKLREKCASNGTTYSDKMMEELKDSILNQLAGVLAGKKNVGKIFHTISFRDDDGDLCEWKVTPIDNKSKDFIEGQLKIADKADSATTSAIGLHPALSNIMVAGKLASGSEMLYALKLYLSSDTAIPEGIIMEAINTAIKINWPDKDVKLGFYHKVVLTEESVSPDDRTKNKV
jgi:hypothetical protein